MKQIRTAGAKTTYFGWCNQHSALLWTFTSNTTTCLKLIFHLFSYSQLWCNYISSNDMAWKCVTIYSLTLKVHISVNSVSLCHWCCLTSFMYLFSLNYSPVVIWSVRSTKNMVNSCIFVLIRMPTARQKKMLVLCC